MQVTEMVRGVQLGVQKVDSFAFDTLRPEEILYYLNKGQREFVRAQNGYLRENLERLSRADLVQSIDAFDNLSSVLITDLIPGTAITASTQFGNAVTVDLTNLSEKMFQYAYSQAQVTNLSAAKVCKPISPADIHKYSKTEYNSPLFRRLPLLLTANKILVFLDEESDGLDQLTLMYIKELKELVLDTPSATQTITSELPPHTHDGIVDVTVNMILEDFKSQRPAKPQQESINDQA